MLGPINTRSKTNLVPRFPKLQCTCGHFKSVKTSSYDLIFKTLLHYLILKKHELDKDLIFNLTWVSSNKCVACFLYTLGEIRFPMMSFWLGLICVSLIHQFTTHERVVISRVFRCLLQVTTSHCNELDIFISHLLSTT
jgi:hypothetical protein